MKITRRQLRQLIKEELITEQKAGLTRSELQRSMNYVEKLYQTQGRERATQTILRQARAARSALDWSHPLRSGASNTVFSRMSPPQFALALAVAAGSLEATTALQRAMDVLPTASGRPITYRDVGDIDLEWTASEISDAAAAAAAAVGDAYDEYVSDYMPWNW